MMDDFELVSAYLDGEVTNEERTRVESDQKLMREVQELRSLSNELGKVLPNDPLVKNSHIQTALQQMEVSTSPSVIPITNKNKRFRSFSKPSRILGAVAAAVLVVLAIPLFRSGDNSSTQIASETVDASNSQGIEESVSGEVTEETSNSNPQPEPAPSTSSSDTGQSLENEDIAEREQSLAPESVEDSSRIEVEEKSQDESLSDNETPNEPLQALTTSGEIVNWGPVNTYTSFAPNEYGSYLLQDVRIETGEEFDTFIIQLTATTDDPPSMVPGPYAIRVNEESFVREESPRSVPADIYEHLVIEISGRGGTWTTEEEYEPSWGSFEQRIEAEGSNLTGIYFGDLESNLTFILGIESGSSFRSFQALEPPRLVIEVDHLVNE
jgi:hypothetical protein